MTLDFPPNTSVPTPVNGTKWTDGNGIEWTATTYTVGTNTIFTWTPTSALVQGAFMYRGFADLTQPIPDNDIGAGTLYSVLATTQPGDMNTEWGGLQTGQSAVEANQLIICTSDTPGQNPQYIWNLVATPLSPFIRSGSKIVPVNMGDTLAMKTAGQAGGNIELTNYTDLPS